VFEECDVRGFKHNIGLVRKTTPPKYMFNFTQIAHCSFC